ncbi:hypothetical protein Taro_045483 [Colocasia esculenta]|uniref:Uncharacterized protein n=1 Tax=Colocasia esculenta TaxID=4460 RepID=A0A843X4W3_COLES|nr:hypothetical protein [Colocasia esculenta]
MVISGGRCVQHSRDLGHRDMVVVTSGRPVASWGLSVKTEATPHSPPLALSLLLLPSSSSLELPCNFSSVLGARGARAEVVSSRSCRGRAHGARSEEEVAIPM